MLTAAELSFLEAKKIPLERTFDATGLPKPAYQAQMRANDLWVAYGTTPCRRYGHRLRTRAGHCLQCNPMNLSFQKRHNAAGMVYVAYSGAVRLVKIGVGESAHRRVALLNEEQYAGASDWSLRHVEHVQAMGSLESELHALLRFWRKPARYRKEGKWITSREVFRVPLRTAIAFTTHFAEVARNGASSDE